MNILRQAKSVFTLRKTGFQIVAGHTILKCSEDTLWSPIITTVKALHFIKTGLVSIPKRISLIMKGYQCVYTGLENLFSAQIYEFFSQIKAPHNTTILPRKYHTHLFRAENELKNIKNRWLLTENSQNKRSQETITGFKISCKSSQILKT